MDKTFAKQLKQARALTGLSQQGMAERMLISKRTIEKWEIGERTPPEYVQRFVLNELKNLTEGEAAHWVTVHDKGLGYHKECPACGARWMLDSQEHVCKETPFCHNCGTKLEKEGEG